MVTTYNLQPTTPPLTFIFIGRSGCGKGTQVKLLEGYLSKNDPSRRVLSVETGDNFRSFLSGGSYASSLAKEIYNRGELQPEFLAVYMWADFMIKNITGNEHLILDGSPRRLREAMVLDTALTFFKRQSPVIIHINVSAEWSKLRLKDRKREDDIDEKEVNRRLSWFETEVLPTIYWFRATPGYKVIDVNGEQPIPDVFNELANKVFGK